MGTGKPDWPLQMVRDAHMSICSLVEVMLTDLACLQYSLVKILGIIKSYSGGLYTVAGMSKFPALGRR
jgi:hypothetical protein